MKWILAAVVLMAGCSAPEGAWTWFNDPRAIEVGNALVVGAVGPDGSVKVLVRKHGFWRAQQLDGPRWPDDHDNPAFVQLPDGRVLAFFSRHNSPEYMMAEAGEDLVFGGATNIAPQLGYAHSSYANPVVTAQGVSLFFRCGRDPDWTICRSDSPDGRQWSAGVPLLDSEGQRPYFKLTSSGERLDFAFTDGHPDEIQPNPIRHFYFEAGRYYTSDGADLGEPPFNVNDLPKLAENGWIWDIKPGLIAYTTFDRYYLATWDNGWHSEDIAPAGAALYRQQPYYRGGIAIRDDAAVYTSDGVNIYLHERGDGWAPQKIGQGIRPFTVAGGVLWMGGEYRSFNSFNTQVRWKR